MLFKNKEEIQEFLPISSSFAFYKIKPYIYQAEQEYLIKTIGQDMYNAIEQYYNGDYSVSSGSDTEDATVFSKLLYLSQNCVIRLAMYFGFDMLNIRFSDKGFTRTETAQEKSAYRYQEDNIKDGYKNSGFDALDTILMFLEDSIEYFHEFSESDNYTILKGQIVKDTITFHKIYSINKSRLVFMHMQQFMARVEDFIIKKQLGEELYYYIKDELKKDSPQSKATSLLPYIQKPLVYISVSEGVMELGIDISNKGLMMLKSASSSISLKQSEISSEKLVEMSTRARDVGYKYLEELKSYLVNNSETYPEYSGQTGNIYNRNNTEKKTFWA